MGEGARVDEVWMAIDRGRWADAARLAGGPGRDYRGALGATPLMRCACETRDKGEALSVARALLAAGADPWARNQGGGDALMMSLVSESAGLQGELIARAKADGKLGRALRDCSSMRAPGAPAAVWELLKAGADPDERKGAGLRSAREAMLSQSEPQRSRLLGALRAFEEGGELWAQTARADEEGMGLGRAPKPRL